MPPGHLSARNLTIAAAGAIILIALGAYLFTLQGGTLTIPDMMGTSTNQTMGTSTGLTPEQEAQLIEQSGLDIRSDITKATAFKAAGNYKAAIDVLVSVGKTYPGNVVSFNNLGDIYLNFTKEYSKAEAAYMQVIKNDPRQLNAYHQLYEIYTQTALKNEISAKSILEQGIAANPKAFDLMVLLAQYYKERGQNAQARAQYEAAITAANASGNASAAASIQAELNQLSQ